MGPDERKPCPVCGESIAMTARQCRFCGEFFESPDAATPKSKPSAKEGYNLVADTVTGVNLRWSDNKFQAVWIGISVLVCGLLGMILAALNPGWQMPWILGGFVGGFAGLVLGTFASGIYLMIYRARRHLQGKHD
jgi:hypothetical protein